MNIEWLGQAGFLLKGTTTSVAIDPYLSDLVEHELSAPRQMAPPRPPAEIGADVVLASHWHPDHLDLDSAVEFANAGVTFVAPPSCIQRLVGRGVDRSQLIPIVTGQEVWVGDATITAVPALHQLAGWITEDAVGYVVEIDGVRVYHSGDTDYDRRMLAANDGGPLDAALVCINGVGGNMNVWEAACLAAQLDVRVAVPMHWGMWTDDDYGPGATLDPAEFVELYSRFAPGRETHVPSLSEELVLDRG